MPTSYNSMRCDLNDSSTPITVLVILRADRNLENSITKTQIQIKILQKIPKWIQNGPYFEYIQKKKRISKRIQATTTIPAKNIIYITRKAHIEYSSCQSLTDKGCKFNNNDMQNHAS